MNSYTRGQRKVKRVFGGNVKKSFFQPNRQGTQKQTQSEETGIGKNPYRKQQSTFLSSYYQVDANSSFKDEGSNEEGTYKHFKRRKISVFIFWGLTTLETRGIEQKKADKKPKEIELQTYFDSQNMNSLTDPPEPFGIRTIHPTTKKTLDAYILFARSLSDLPKRPNTIIKPLTKKAANIIGRESSQGDKS